MASRPKTGGRQRGTPHKRTEAVTALLAQLNCGPIEGMAQIAMDEKNPPELRGRMFAELAGYIYPKRKAVEVKADEGPKVVFHFHDNPAVSAEQGYPKQ